MLFLAKLIQTSPTLSSIPQPKRTSLHIERWFGSGLFKHVGIQWVDNFRKVLQITKATHTHKHRHNYASALCCLLFMHLSV